MSSSRGLNPVDLARALVAGARRELDLTPKPGLVDMRDNGSHPDLTHDAMARSIDLLPIYHNELLMHADCGDFDACIRAGRAAEERMFAAIGTNAHKGYIFLSGVALLGGLSKSRFPWMGSVRKSPRSRAVSSSGSTPGASGEGSARRPSRGCRAYSSMGCQDMQSDMHGRPIPRWRPST